MFFKLPCETKRISKPQYRRDFLDGVRCLLKLARWDGDDVVADAEE